MLLSLSYFHNIDLSTTPDNSPPIPVLILNYRKKYTWGQQEPVITDTSGYVRRNVRFNYEENTEIFNSCGLTWKSRYYVFGGETFQRQISRIDNCALKSVGQLPFNFEAGACTNVVDTKIYLCFDSEDNKRCFQANSPTSSYQQITSSANDHANVRIGSSADFVLAVGSRRNLKSEVLAVANNRWTSLEDWPFNSVTWGHIYRAPIIFVGNSFYLLGGQRSHLSASWAGNTIGRMDTQTWKWTQAGELVRSRRDHNAIVDGSRILVVGGYGNLNTETCQVSNGEVSCQEQEPKLDDYYSWPELYPVTYNFCKP